MPAVAAAAAEAVAAAASRLPALNSAITGIEFFISFYKIRSEKLSDHKQTQTLSNLYFFATKILLLSVE